MNKKMLEKINSIIDIAENLERSIPVFAKNLAPAMVKKAQGLISELRVLKAMIEEMKSE